MKLIIVRHGETIENREGVIQGHLHGTLSQLGKTQAKNIAKVLKNEKIDFIYSSDLTRAADTAKEIAKPHSHISIIFTKELRERYLGKFQGRRKSELGLKKDESLVKFLLTSSEKEMEPLEEMLQRAKKFLKKTLNKHKNNTVLFVTHNGFAKALICAITNKSANEIPKLNNLENTEAQFYEVN